jgi:hypothetical protein
MHSFQKNVEPETAYGLENNPATAYVSVTMKKVKFDNSQSIALQKGLGVTLASEQMEPLTIEGWLVDDHVCIQKPSGERGWRVSLYPWGDRISLDFFSKDDATEYAREVSELGIDWKAVYAPENYVRSELYFEALAKVIAVRDQFEADGYFKPPQ